MISHKSSLTQGMSQSVVTRTRLVPICFDEFIKTFLTKNKSLTETMILAPVVILISQLNKNNLSKRKTLKPFIGFGRINCILLNIKKLILSKPTKSAN